ncbi:MAG: phosphoribosylformylglycinamidine synthase [Candidatus Tokpelaia sp. JSC161]|jgi:phosphoribosylformylglycinamidine synthase|nr:MAG: phosphoribosylformylglycinamidine synthase [Candidatus Tokpelaia sp. JSC161]
MKTAIIQFPGLNRDRDMIAALEKITGHSPYRIWQSETTIPTVDMIVIPGGFSFGDYLRCGAIAARQPIMKTIRIKAEEGVPILGVCNGFQILLEAGILEGTLIHNSSLKFICREITLEVMNNQTLFSHKYRQGEILRFPIAHKQGSYFAESETLSRLKKNRQIVFRYANENPNGSIHKIAGITNKRGNVLGIMPHPENCIETAHGRTDGHTFFSSIVENFNKHNLPSL